jgi:LysR family transcriptional activator of glutamate synthase operon
VRDELVDSVLDRGEADLVISTLRSADPAARRQRLLDEPLRLAVPSDHRMAQATEIRLADAAEDRFVMVRPGSLLRQACDDLCRAAGFQPEVSFEGDDLTTVLGFVAVGLGVAIAPAAGEGSPGPGAAPVRYLRITDVAATREIGLAWAADGRLLPAAELFRDHVIDRVRQRRLPAVSR